MRQLGAVTKNFVPDITWAVFVGISSIINPILQMRQWQARTLFHASASPAGLIKQTAGPYAQTF